MLQKRELRALVGVSGDRKRRLDKLRDLADGEETRKPDDIPKLAWSNHHK